MQFASAASRRRLRAKRSRVKFTGACLLAVLEELGPTLQLLLEPRPGCALFLENGLPADNQE